MKVVRSMLDVAVKMGIDNWTTGECFLRGRGIRGPGRQLCSNWSMDEVRGLGELRDNDVPSDWVI